MLIALDFETANASNASVCAVGLAWLDEATGLIVRRAGSLVRPPAGANAFSPFNVRVHGIRERDVADAPEWPAVWRRIASHLAGATILAHNAAFDVGVLRAVCQAYGLPVPPGRYLCTCRLSKRLWPELNNHRLNTVCAAFGFHFKHHHAQADAEACARIYRRAIETTGCRDPECMAGYAGLRLENL